MAGTSQMQSQQQQRPTNETTHAVTRPPEEAPQINTMEDASKPKVSANSTTDQTHQAATSILPKEKTLRQQPQLHPQPQQLHQHHQCHQIQAHAHQHHPHPHMMACCPPMPALFTPFPPWLATTCPATTPAAMFCCSRHQHWHNTPGRRGRPPHDDHCQQTRRLSDRLSGKPEKNGRDDPNGVVI